jgi:EmrB/QacA subfamily drug resistance transporter
MVQQLTDQQLAADRSTVKRTPSVHWALASLSLSMLMPALDTSIANVGLPTLARAFNASFQDVQWIVLAYLLAITTLIVSAGRLGDIIGRRRLLLTGIGVFTVASLLCGIAPTLWLLVAARAAQGLGAAVMIALTMALVGDTMPKSRIGSAMGWLGTMSAIGTALGPSLGGVLIASVGWPVIFLVNIPLGAVNFVLALRTLPADATSSRPTMADFDYVGTVLLAFTLAAYALAMTTSRDPLSAKSLTLLSAAIGTGIVFVLMQARSASPLLRLAMFRHRALSAGLAMNALVSTVVMSTLVVGPFYLSRGLGLDAGRVGIVMSVGPLVAALTGVMAGRILGRLGAQRMATIGLLGMGVGLLLVAPASAQAGVVGYIAAIAVVTSHFALFQAANNTTIMSDAGPQERGVIAGMLSLSRNLGLITGVSALGAVFAFASSSTDVTTALPQAVAAGMRVTFNVAALLILVAIAVAAIARSSGARTRVGSQAVEAK